MQFGSTTFGVCRYKDFLEVAGLEKLVGLVVQKILESLVVEINEITGLESD